MSRVEQKAVRARLVPAALGLGIALTVTGCGAGMMSQTAVQVAAVNGASGKVGAIELRDGQLAFPAEKHYAIKSSAPLIITLVNSGANDDKLVSVSSPAAASVQVKGETALVAGFALRAHANEPEHGSAGATSTPGATTTTPSSTSGRPNGSSATPTSSSAPTTSIDNKLKVGSVIITVTDLKRVVWPGQTIPIKFTFAKAGEVTLDVPIAADEEHRVEPTRSGGSHGGGGGGGGH